MLPRPTYPPAPLQRHRQAAEHKNAAPAKAKVNLIIKGVPTATSKNYDH